MKVVVASAFRRALAVLVLCLGVVALLWTLSEPSQSDLRDGYLLLPLGYVPRSLWDIPIAIGIAAACVLAAALIYPARRPSRRLLRDRQARRVEDDLRVLHR